MREVNFDGLVGPTFTYGGIASGNLASEKNGGTISNPRQAALQGLEKMRSLFELGVPQGIFPPHFRPHLPIARRLGFGGSDLQVLRALRHEAPEVLAACYSSAAMWTANAATVCPSPDALDKRVHLTPANLQCQLHRSIEASFTKRFLRTIFANPDAFVIHEPLPASATTGDEGGANHTRLCQTYASAGLQVFVYGAHYHNTVAPKPKCFPARQTLEACRALARLHRLSSQNVIFAQQHPDAIDAGVFHNDVISVGDRNLFLFHEEAFWDPARVIHDLQHRFHQLTNQPLHLVPVHRAELSLATCVTTYLFNSQLVLAADGRTVLIAPTECEEHSEVRALIHQWVDDADVPLDAVVYQEVGQSMLGGGGPACLRLRVPLTDHEYSQVHPGAIYTPEIHQQLREWITHHYRDRLGLDELADPQLVQETEQALDELTQITSFGSIYPFQQNG